MATIKTDEDGELIVERSNRPQRFRVVWSVKIYKGDVIYSRDGDRDLLDIWAVDDTAPMTRKDLTTDAMANVVESVKRHLVDVDKADNVSDISIDSVTIKEVEDVKTARRALAPSFDEDWPEDGSASDQVRFMLENYPTQSDEEMAVIAGCSRSLVSELKNEE